MSEEQKVGVPFSEDQVESLQAFQESGVMHPFTCGGCDSREPLQVGRQGFFCPHCSYRQDWAHWFMANWQWVYAHFKSRTAAIGKIVWAAIKKDDVADFLANRSKK